MSQPVQVRIIPYGSGEYKQEVALRDEVLRRPIGRSIYTEDLSAEEHVQHVGAFMNGKLVGTMYLKSLDAQTCQIKQVAVKESYRGHNIGRKMMCFIQELALSQGANKLVLDSRPTAAGFYEKVGFVNTGVEVRYFDIPHYKMVKMIP